MFRKLFFLLFVYGLTSTVCAQSISEKGGGILNLERHQFTLLAGGLRYELGLFRNVSASTSFSPALAYYSKGYTFGMAWHTRLRYYHNFRERLDINKNVVGNSANYIGPARSAFFGCLQFLNNLDRGDGFNVEFFGGVYGVQRTFRKGLNINAELGFGYYRGDGVDNGYGGLLHVTLGWVATKRRSRKPTFN